MRARPSTRWSLITVALAAMVVVAALAAVPAAASTPTCSAVLFTPVDEAGAFMVEQPGSAPGAIFCEPSSGSIELGLANSPKHGSITDLEPNGLGGASFEYSPSSGFAGADTFTLSAREGEGSPVSVQVDVSVRPASNDPPSCSIQLTAYTEAGSYVAESGVAVGGSIDCFDDEGAELAFMVDSDPEHGTLSEITSEGSASGSFSYTPSPGYQGSDRFALVANDGAQDSAPVEVEVSVVAAVDDPPRCAATMVATSDPSGGFEIEQGEALHGAITCVDAEGEALDFGVAAAPRHGALSPLSSPGDGGVDLTYAPASGYLGFDSFRVDVSDGVNPPVPVSVHVRVVAPRNDPPTCTAQLLAPVAEGSYRVGQGSTVEGELDCEDDEGAPLSYGVATAPQHGSIGEIGTDGHFSYGAPASYVGPDQFALVADDGTQDSQPVSIPVAVAAAGDEPPACEVTLGTGTAADEYVVERDSEAEGRIVCSDEAAAELALTVAAVPNHGSIVKFEKDGPKSASFSYLPSPGYTGPDAFTLAADDGVADPRSTAVPLQVVEPSPHAPNCQARLQTPRGEGAYEVESGETVAGTLTCFDADGDELSFAVAGAPAHGSIADLESAGDGVGRFTYTAGSAWTGPDSFSLVASDGTRNSNAVDLEVEVVPAVNDPPDCSVSLFSERSITGAYPAEEGEANPGAIVCVDDEGEPLTFTVASGPQHGAITGLQSEGEWAPFDYDAAAGYLGADVVTLSAHDAAGSHSLVTLELAVGPAIDTAPSCTATLNAPLSGERYRIEAGASAAGEISCTDAELDPLAFSLIQSPSRGTLSALAGIGTARSFTYTAATGQSGPDLFSFKANDGHVDSAPVVVALQVEPPAGTGGGGTGGGGGPPSQNSPAPPAALPAASPTPPAGPKPKKCHKGFTSKKAHGKVKCVKKTKKHKAKRHRR